MKFSVLISVYFKENPVYFKESLLSLVNQSLMPNEIVLVKDGPLTEDLEKVINYFITKYPELFVVIPIEKNSGLGNALRVGTLNCRFDWIARMDTDDICTPDRFEKQIAFLKNNPHIDILGSALEEFNDKPGDLKSFRILPKEGKSLLRYSKLRSPVNHPTIIFKKETVLKSGGYRADFLLFEDYALFIKMLHDKAYFYNLPVVLLHFRIGDGLATIKRRSGWHYVKKELKFIQYGKDIGFFSRMEQLAIILIKIPLRLLPPKVILFIYSRIFRQSDLPK